MGVEQDTHRVTLAILPEEARDSSLRTWEEWCTGSQYVNTVMTSEFLISILKDHVIYTNPSVSISFSS